MFTMRYAVCLLLGGVLLAGATGDGSGNEQAAKPDNEIIQEFPSNGEMETAWKVRWATARGNGLYIQEAWFKRGPTDRWIQILGDARVSELFVPYHRGNPRFWDVSYNFFLSHATHDDAGPFGKLLRDGEGNPPTVIQEIRDRGVIWKGNAGSRRGQALVLWGTLEAANYRYLMEYSFQDDGAVVFRLGATGRNYGGSEYIPHTHNTLWRIDVNLDGADNNSVYTVEHVEPMPQAKLQASTELQPFNGGTEGSYDWTAEKFTMLRVVNDKVTNSRGDPLAYDLMSPRYGNSRHYKGGKEDCMLHDFWVTRAQSNELEYPKVMKYVANGESIMNSDVVLWHNTPSHHEPRLEDGKVVNGELQGCTHVNWATFYLKPRNLFEQTPLYPYGTAAAATKRRR